MSRVDSHDRDDPAWRERLTAYLDGELSPAEAREVQAWLEAHPAALRALEEDRRVWSLLAAYREEGVPAGFSDRVLSNTGAPGTSGTPGADGADGADGSAGAAARLTLLSGGRARRFAAMAATVVLAVGVGAFAANRLARAPETGASPGLASSALDAVPAALLDTEDAVTKLASLSDDEFDALLQDDPEKLAQAIK